MPLDVQTRATPFDVGASRQESARQRTAIEHEVVRLLDDLAPTRMPARRRLPAATVQAYRWPNRCVLQGESRAISLTWFPGSSDDATIGELLVIAWQGTVSLPGSGQRRSGEAVAVAERLLHLEAAPFGGWEWWATTRDATGLASSALADYCRDQVAPAESVTAQL